MPLRLFCAGPSTAAGAHSIPRTAARPREQELWFEEEVIDDDDPDMQATYEASRRSLVEDEVRR